MVVGANQTAAQAAAEQIRAPGDGGGGGGSGGGLYLRPFERRGSEQARARDSRAQVVREA